ncbi:hypothetical protein MKW92_040902 [Papaver armeniacum]|nr:hypothetical protein MKW92_040902 [Papaver armeniacum]
MPKIRLYARNWSLIQKLASHDLSNGEAIKCRLKNELLHSSPSENQDYVEIIVDKSGKEVLNCLDMLRSVGDGDWKLKQDTDEYRVMYRQGPQGTLLHSLLVEGFVDGHVCVCLGLEVALFHRWWPQFNFPTFKIIESKCAQKVQMGEQIALVRMKCAWPLSAREVVVHCFEVTDTKSVDRSTHGFTNDGIPEVKDVVRAELVGGFALQKLTSNRRIVTMNIKPYIVPLSLINFLLRQIVGSGFKLYKKAVASVAKGDEDFGQGLKRTQCMFEYMKVGITRIELKMDSEPDIPMVEKSAHNCHGKSGTESLPVTVTAKTSLGDHLFIQSKQEDTSVSVEQHPKSEEAGNEILSIDQSSSRSKPEQISKEKKVVFSPEVEHALGILNNVISMVRGSGIDIQICAICVESLVKEVCPYQTTQTTTKQNLLVPEKSQDDVLNSSRGRTVGESPRASVLENMSKDYSEVPPVNGNYQGSNITNGGENSRQRKKHCFCCFHSAADQ